MSSEDNTSGLKKAASLLLKGATLTSEQCPKCGGVQVRFENRLSCVNCGQVEDTEVQGVIPGAVEDARQTRQPSEPLNSRTFVAAIIEEKIVHLSRELKDENDIESQRRMAELLETYLRVFNLLKD